QKHFLEAVWGSRHDVAAKVEKPAGDPKLAPGVFAVSGLQGLGYQAGGGAWSRGYFRTRPTVCRQAGGEEACCSQLGRRTTLMFLHY
ncbi:1-deoxy-D-xylulose-5-phosphate synthase, partial [Dissostichus eleginoides]